MEIKHQIQLNLNEMKMFKHIIDEKNEYTKKLYRASFIITGTIPFIFLIQKFITKEHISIPFILSVLFFFSLLIFSFYTKNIEKLKTVIIIASLFFLIISLLLPDTYNSWLIIIFGAIPLAFYTQGVKRALDYLIVFSLLFLTIIFLYQLNFIKNISFTFNPMESIVIFFSFIINLILIYISEKYHEKYFDRVIEKIVYDDITNFPKQDVLFNNLDKTKNYILTIIRIENFSNLISIFGYEFSENILYYLAKKINRIEKEYNFLPFRLINNEFALLFEIEKNNPKEKIYKDIELIQKKLSRNRLKWGKLPINLFLRFGITIIENGNGEKALSNADISLKKHKDKEITMYHQSDDNKENFLNNIIKINLLINIEERLKVVYQPIYNSNKEIEWYECLLRIRNDRYEYESIFNYLKLARALGIYEKISRFVINNAVEQAKNTNKMLSINISINDIANDSFLFYLKEKSFELGENINKIILEILEEDEALDMKKSINNIEIAKKIGYKIAIDDFGAGYSNIVKFIEMPTDILKIDGHVIKEILNDKSIELIVDTVVIMAKHKKLKVVAEFVENKEIFDKLKDMNLDYYQGYYLSKPIDKIDK
ncbi:EAL domain-containing protein (putative c-di-GMP-specific phosphodiesterase class I) [Hypnocyclicus thermotrophus]|uniref:EAL domain-containing protein (Putative c-di-GMP-specific phosphodiesterase class I) n=1 Tax=Hypnocyclicus thermotrophus TaxID=1627895 RepID=A0AA46DZ79_9FUSO|nr:EAL domain-containing protein [Hypnocyclicus thermotrophus]TDT71451.1 EAL domain-containing protein (putative c-di-GMP-specific phosphodiesterase class I) [Hypnocyclicus thermotrophus]